MVLSYTTSPAYHMIAESESRYQAASFSDGHGMQIEVAAKLKNAPNPELADRFMQFILTQDFQSIIPMGNWMFPVVSLDEGLPEDFGKLVNPAISLMMDAGEISQNKGGWIDEFNQALSN